MFWRMAGYSQPSPLEAILDMDGFSLEDLLDEADIIQVLCMLINSCRTMQGGYVAGTA